MEYSLSTRSQPKNYQRIRHNLEVWKESSGVFRYPNSMFITYYAEKGKDDAELVVSLFAIKLMSSENDSEDEDELHH